MKPSACLTFVSHNEADTIKYGACLGTLLPASCLVALIGNLGTGKTRWAQGIGQGLAVPPETVINSPTFTFVNQYQGRLVYYHIDLYRLQAAKEAETLGLDDYFYSDGICVVEWADRVGPLLPSERLEIHLQDLGETKRQISMCAYGQAYQTLLNQFQARAMLKEAHVISH